jgi:hypothetical protein
MKTKIKKRNFHKEFYFSFTLFSILILCAIVDLRRLAPTNVVVDTTEDDECPWPFI